MLIQRFVLVLAAVSAATPLSAQTFVTNGGFNLTSTRGGDDSLARNRVGAWRVAYGTPQIIMAEDGCGDPNYVALSTKAAGDAIHQPVALMKGVPYEVSLCARQRKGEIPNAHFELRTSTMPLGGPACPAATCEAMTGAQDITTNSWKAHHFQFTPSRDYAYLTISTSNDTLGTSIDTISKSKALAADDGWAEVDNVSVTLAVTPGKPAPVINADAQNAIPDQYIVLLRPGTTARQADDLEKKVKKIGGKILKSYRTGVLGFAAHLEQDALTMVLANRLVLWVEADQKMSSSSVAEPVSSRGVDRIDQRLLPLNSTFQYTETGEGVHAYVLDTGIRTSHQEFFGGRASSDFTSAENDGREDCAGHGTHVAATLGGTKYGIARKVQLHSVRVMDCDGQGTLANVIAGVNWITDNKILPAVANMSISGETMMPSLDNAIQTSIDSGVTYVVAAHNRARDACHYSPARIPNAITVGAVNPKTDVRWVMSNDGPCVDLFAPGVAILSAGIADDEATAVKAGTSMATAHVAGVAALALELNPRATPSDVWNKIHDNNNVSTTPNWPGIIDWQGLIDEHGMLIPGVGSPNELLHWGPLSEGYDDGDPHITTVDGTHYNFQSAGELVLLRGGSVEIQTRQTPVSTTSNPGPDPYDDLATCVSLNTAVAARVGSHRVTYQPNLTGVPDPNGMQLRIDGDLAPLNAQGINLVGGGRVVKTAIGDGLEIQFPDDTILTAVPGWWTSQEKWFLNIHVNRTRATDGIMGAIAPGSWLPALPNGKSMGSMPPTLHDRFVDLNQTFADAWRVTETDSLFDYAPGTSTRTFTIPDWPRETSGCTLTGETPARPVEPPVAREACRGLRDKQTKADCVFDVIVTGEAAFAKTYLLSQRLQFGATSVVVTADRDSSTQGERVTFTATVALLTPRVTDRGRNVIPTGTVQFFVNGEKAGKPARLEVDGNAHWTTSGLLPGTHQVSARYLPRAKSEFLTSSSADRVHTIIGN